jgi:aspartate aminotransferase-like enzyme
MKRQNLRIPGPTPVPLAVRQAGARSMINHRGPEFAALLQSLQDLIRPFFGSTGDVLFFPAAGTGGLEAAAVNTLSPGDKVLALSIGAFGDRFAQIAQAFGADVQRLEVAWGQACAPEALERTLTQRPGTKAVLLTHNETSTGVQQDVPSLAAVVRESGALLLVDAISSLGAVPFDADRWGVDVTIAGSQKAWMVPPGMAMLAVSRRAWDAHATAQMPRFYWDFTAMRRSMARGQTPYTPPISLMFALEAALRRMHAEGKERIFERHAQLAQRTRAGLVELGLELVADPACASQTVTAAWLPPGIEWRALARTLREEHGVVIAGGQGKLEGEILRIGHLGSVSERDIDGALRALRRVLSRLGYTPGQGTRAGGPALPGRQPVAVGG